MMRIAFGERTLRSFERTTEALNESDAMMDMRSQRRTVCGALAILLICCGLWHPTVYGSEPTTARTSLSKFMNSVPPSKDYFCVGNGPTNLALHPDRAPHTDLARQGAVVLFSGAAPQQGLNFAIPVGALVYRNQMSTLGSPEPSPQVGTAGTLQQEAWDFFLPWSEARWHPGEDITWQGFRAHPYQWIGGLPFWDLPISGEPTETIRATRCGSMDDPEVHKPYMVTAQIDDRIGFSPKAAFNLQLSRGIYQASKIRPDWSGMTLDECPFSFREPWFQARGIDPVFNVSLSTTQNPFALSPVDCETMPTDPFCVDCSVTPDDDDCFRLAKDFFPTFLNIYNYEKLELDGGRMSVDFTRSSTWPREPTGIQISGESSRGAITGTSMASDVRDEYGNRVHFDRVPKYGWETDYKTPHVSGRIDILGDHLDTSFVNVSRGYTPVPNAWRMPHKRLRTVQLFEADDDVDIPSWTIAYVYEHPESDRIEARDTPKVDSNGEEWEDNWREWKSIYSFLPQADWAFGRLPELNDETTLLTVQAYSSAVMGNVKINGAEFRDDLWVWRNTMNAPSDTEEQKKARARALTGAVYNGVPAYEGDANGDGCPGICDLDGTSDKDCNNLLPTNKNYGQGCPDVNQNFVPDFVEDDDEDGFTRGAVAPRFFEDPPGSGRNATDPPGEAFIVTGQQEQSTSKSTVGFAGGGGGGSVDGCPGICGQDDDGDGLIDEDTNGYQAYLAVSVDDCAFCQACLQNNSNFSPIPDDCKQNGVPVCHDANAAPLQTWVPQDPICKNPFYWRYDGTTYTDVKMDPFAHWDDDEDGLIDEDGGDDPLLVDLRALTDATCASGKYPYVPSGATLPNRGGLWTTDCRPVINAGEDPWTYQVQYVYARTNPFWLLVGRNADGSRSYLDDPKYHYYVPFSEPFKDTNGDGVRDPNAGGDDAEPFFDINRNGEFNTFEGDDDISGLPNVHPDCVPSPKFRGPQGKSSGGAAVDPVKPSDIHLIKRIVRMRGDISDPDNPDPSNYIESVWLYRYSDAGFLKAVFDPASVQEIIDADTGDEIKTPDNILQYADTHDVAGQPLIMYASQWYTFYNPYVKPVVDGGEIIGIPACYDTQPLILGCMEGALDLTDPNYRLPHNACDGEIPWTSGYGDEMEIDTDCSPYMRQDCGWCYAREACGATIQCTPTDPACTCSAGASLSENQLSQLGIPGAQPRFRKYLIKTARMRGNDGAMHLYRFDYLGAASSVYGDNDQITSYADPHNITIVDEIVEQTTDEAASSINRNEFYIYEDDFRLNLDAAELRPGAYAGGDFRATSHYLYTPGKVKTRRVVVMNYYGIAISDRLILTPGFVGDQTSLVDNQQYELLNSRGQTKHIFDPSWVAALRTEQGENLIKDTGRVLVELFGGEGGWYSVLRGIAKGSGAGNLYNQQCVTEAVLKDVPVQRVAEEQLVVVSMTEHFQHDTSNNEDIEELELRDMPIAEASYYGPALGSTHFASIVDDPAGTIGNLDDTACNMNDSFQIPCECGTPACPDGPPAPGFETCMRMDSLLTIDLHNQLPVTVDLAGVVATDAEGDGVSMVRYHYIFYDEDERRVKWKYRWLEKVSPDFGGSDDVALELWYFYLNGRIRFQGRGAGEAGTTPPSPKEPFVFTYFGFDAYGRPNLQIQDVNMTKINNNWPFGITPAVFEAIGDLGVGMIDSGMNLVTLSSFNDFGALKSKSVGLLVDSDATLVIDPNEWAADVWDQVQRTDYKLLANRTIRDTSIPEEFVPVPDWQDPYSYSFVYNSVSLDGETVHGTTTISISDKSGKPIEQRVIGWNPARATDGDAETKMTDKIENVGWGISLADYTYDGAIEGWGGIPNDDYWSTCAEGATPDCTTYIEDNKTNFDPPPPMDADNGNALLWPPGVANQLVTLARSFKLYEQASTLKPTHDIVYSSFDQAPPDPAGSDPDRREVIRQYSYDIEDRVARQKEADGTITRSLFDAKRRPTKIFRGSADGCPDWFPRVFSTSEDDMVLTEQRLYNDGTKTCEHTENPFTGVCETETDNEDFPYDAGKLVRVRRFTDNAEACSGNDAVFDPETRSRDTQYVYDWRGRQVISKEVTVVSGGGTAAAPHVISATVTVFDNLDRPFAVASFHRSTTGDPPNTPTLDRIELWEQDATFVRNTHKDWFDQFDADLWGYGPSSLSTTFYDERGRVYEQRSYDPENLGNYAVTRTYRDDLDRVTKTATSNGTTSNKYDARGRVVETSLWTENNTANHRDGSGFELTRTVRTYDVYGQVLTVTRYDRKPDADISTALGSAAIVTYTYNWYDEHTKRLVATANFGTGEEDGYTTNTAGPKVGGNVVSYNANSPPTWNGTQYTYNDTEALVTLYGYDAAGRRDYVRDPMGIVSKTWFDLLGRTLLVAENWDDGNTTPFVGPTRYTANHFTRGGLLDMMVAIIPDAANANLKVVPAGFPAPIGVSAVVWDDDFPDTDFAAKGVSVLGAAVQATRFVYGADVVNESDHADVSDAPNLVAKIEYPLTSTIIDDAGQPNPNDALTFTYTIAGQVALRTDQRGVTLEFQYGSDSTCTSCSSSPGNQPTEVRVAYAQTGGLDDPTDTVDYLSFSYDAEGRLIQAQTYGPSSSPALISEVEYTYDARGNLIQEQLDPTPGAQRAKTVDYFWDWYAAADNKQNRLHDITYPTSSRKFNYKFDGQVWTDGIGRMTGLTEGDITEVPIIDYQMTGGGRNIIQTWGDAKVKLDYHPSVDNPNPSLLDRFGRIKTMDIRKMTGPTTSTIHKYEYGYDANGNRAYARIEQVGHNNNRSYLYGYDNLNRLVDAGWGTISVLNDQATFDPPTERTTTAWGLDLLGNWSGGVTELRDADGEPGGVVHLRTRNHVVNSANEIVRTTEQIGALAAIEITPFAYDDAGNLVFDGVKLYKYDAWNRIAGVYERNDLHVDAAGVLVGTPGNAIALYDYDALGRRIAKSVDTNPTEYFYYDGHRVIEHHKDDGVDGTTLLKQYVYGLNYIDEPVAYYDAAAGVPSTTPHFIMQDANYDVVGITDDQGVLAQQMTLEPYGDYLYIEDSTGTIYNGVDADLSMLETPFGRNAHWFDSETGLHYNRARYYSAKIGRFLQRDPRETALMAVTILVMSAKAHRVFAGLAAPDQYTDGMNLYQFGHSNPSRWTDPTGLDLITDMIPEISFKTRLGWAMEGSAFANLDVGKCRSLVYKELEGHYKKKTGRPTGKGGKAVAWSYIHCVIHCALVKHASCGGEAFSRLAGEATEGAQMVACEAYKLRQRFQKGYRDPKKEEECESAWQRSDYYDNERGRDCARTGENDDDCADCCESRLGGRTRDDLPEGPRTERPFGPHHKDDPGPKWPR